MKYIHFICIFFNYRYLAGQKEFEVELHFTSGLLGYPDRVRSAEEYRDGEKPLPGSTSTMGSDDG